MTNRHSITRVSSAGSGFDVCCLVSSKKSGLGSKRIEFVQAWFWNLLVPEVNKATFLKLR